MNTRFMQPNEKLSLKYTIGSYICACYPVTIEGIIAEVRRQYIGKVDNEHIKTAVWEMLDSDWIENYDDDSKLYSINEYTSGIIEHPDNKFEPR
jgi:hypothetical protein